MRPRTFLCTSSLITLGALATSGCAVTPADSTDIAPVESQQHNLYAVDSDEMWGAVISVCWENTGNDTEKGWVRDAIERSWQLEANVWFQGWNQCSESSPGLHIRTADEWPHTSGVGNDLDRETDGMVLNFWFNF